MRVEEANVSDQAEDATGAVDRSRITRRRFLQGAAALGAAGLGASLPGSRASAAPRRRKASLEHIVVCSQENRSFDHYYGYAPWVGGYGIPAGYSQPDGQGGSVQPSHFLTSSTPDVGHSWSAMHSRMEQRPNGRLLYHGRPVLHWVL